MANVSKLFSSCFACEKSFLTGEECTGGNVLIVDHYVKTVYIH